MGCLTSHRIFVIVIPMKKLVYAIVIVIFGLFLILCGWGGGRGNSNSNVRMIHFLEVTFPQMEKNNGTH